MISVESQDVAPRPLLPLVAFQRVEGREPGRLTKGELPALQDARRSLPLEGAPAHVEIDIKRQVLFVVDDGGAVAKILPVSTGNERRCFAQGQWQRAIAEMADRVLRMQSGRIVEVCRHETKKAPAELSW